MPDDSRLNSQVSEDTLTSNNTSNKKRSVRHFLRNTSIISLVLVILYFTGYWAFNQWSKITETDARITTDQISVSSRSDGWVTKLPVIEGQKIKAGELLLSIDSRDATLKLDELNARLSAIDSQRALLITKTKMVDAQTQSRMEAATSRVKAAYAAVKASKEQSVLTRNNYKRFESLSGTNVISQQRLDQIRAELSRSDERHQIAMANLLAAKADANEAKADRQQILINKNLINNLKYEKQQIVSLRNRQILNIQDKTIRSSLNGVVSRIFIDKGEFVHPGQRLILIHNPNNIWVEANIKETELRHIKLGMTAKLKIDAYPNKSFVGKVERIGQAATGEFALLPNPNPSGNFTKVTQRLPIRISVEQEDDMLRPGMLVVIEIDIPGR
ncbi:MAG: secretion protein HlyD [Rhodospirillales bacterium]|nr:secretion protein HlyD [Rhodospirillales bacterium]